MAPVEVPPTNEKMSRVSWPVVLSSLARTTAGIMPRMPPPSIDNRYRRGTSPPFHPLFRGLARPQKYATNGRSAHPYFSPKGLAPRALIFPPNSLLKNALHRSVSSGSSSSECPLRLDSQDSCF